MSKLSNWLNLNEKSDKHGRETYIEPFLNIQKEFNDLFRRVYRGSPATSIDAVEYTNRALAPYCDIVDDEDHFKVEFEMPGVDEKNIKVSIKNGILTVIGSKETSSKDDGKNYLMREINYGSFERQIALPENVDPSNAEATFKKGMLWVSIPKKSNDKSEIHELNVQKITD